MFLTQLMLPRPPLAVPVNPSDDSLPMIPMKSNTLLFLATLCAFFFSVGSATAQNADEAAITQRMVERVDEIDALKIAGKVGENNLGLLEQRAALEPDEIKLMNAENADRRSLYTTIGRRVGLTQSVVGQGRAEELRRRSASGVWLQDTSGRWYRKE